LLSLSMTFNSLSYFIFFGLPGRLLYWIYEVLHTYFVVTVQFIAFFAIVFWLFMFLYTFFVIEKQENYFTEKRNKRRFYFIYLNSLK
jgi:phosphotransferase system  glucose/maltose/N-acetylglucosamine-specific IIC component